MKLFQSAFLAGTLFSSNSVNAEEVTCDVSELTVPDHAIGWDCDDEIIGSLGALVQDNVPPKTKCWLKCQEGYIDYICE